jgi:alkylation response protein AidB-like acyl-CoA dehydrogenase
MRSARPIGNYQAIQWMLADMATELDAARLLTLKAADARQRQGRPVLEAAMAKLFASEAAHRAADKAMQILASSGTAAARSSSGSFATCVPPKSIRARPRCSAWSLPNTS